MPEHVVCVDINDNKAYVLLLSRCVYSSVQTLSLHSAILLYPSMTNRGVDEGALNEKELNACFRVTRVIQMK